MFFRKEDVENELKCPKCNEKYQDPRTIVPCCETLCMSCIEELTTNDGQLNCFFCNTRHKIPAEGFKRTAAICRLLNIKPNEVIRSKKEEEFIKNLNLLSAKVDELERSFQNSSKTINDHCMMLKNQIHLTADEQILQINEWCKDLVARVEEYENKCVAKNQTMPDSVKKYLAESKMRLVASKNIINQFKVTEELLENENKKIVDNLTRLDDELNKLKRAQFGDNMLMFKRVNAKDLSIGTLYYHSIIDSDSDVEFGLFD